MTITTSSTTSVIPLTSHQNSFFTPRKKLYIICFFSKYKSTKRSTRTFSLGAQFSESWHFVQEKLGQAEDTHVLLTGAIRREATRTTALRPNVAGGGLLLNSAPSPSPLFHRYPHSGTTSRRRTPSWTCAVCCCEAERLSRGCGARNWPFFLKFWR